MAIVGSDASETATGVFHDGPIAMETRRHVSIDNHISWMEPDVGMRLQVEALRAKYPRAYHRQVGPCMTYNCHGLTFASRRTGIPRSSEVQKILAHDGYKLVRQDEAEPGDVVIYRMPLSEGGEIHHSGIVVRRAQSGQSVILPDPLVLSKWGHCHEVVHDARYCDYAENATIEYFRMTR